MRRVPFSINDIIILLPVGDGMVTVPNSVIKNGNTSSPATRELPLKGKPKERVDVLGDPFVQSADRRGVDLQANLTNRP